jgi:ubiquitin C-terminal hydrolase
LQVKFNLLRDITTKEWYEFDDSHVSRVKDPRDVVSSAGYVLFYKRRE